MFFSQADNLVNPVKRYKTLCYQELVNKELIINTF